MKALLSYRLYLLARQRRMWVLTILLILAGVLTDQLSVGTWNGGGPWGLPGLAQPEASILPDYILIQSVLYRGAMGTLTAGDMAALYVCQELSPEKRLPFAAAGYSQGQVLHSQVLLLLGLWVLVWAASQGLVLLRWREAAGALLRWKAWVLPCMVGLRGFLLLGNWCVILLVCYGLQSSTLTYLAGLVPLTLESLRLEVTLPLPTGALRGFFTGVSGPLPLLAALLGTILAAGVLWWGAPRWVARRSKSGSLI